MPYEVLLMKHLWNEALLDGKWELYYDKAEKAYDLYCATRDALAKSELKKIAGSVPGNFELDMLDAGLIEDPFYADNVLALQELEDTYLWYATTFTADIKERREYFLLFEGIDTFGEIYLNGEKIGESDNMFIAQDFEVTEKIKYNEKNYTITKLEFKQKTLIDMSKVLESEDEETIVIMTCAGVLLDNGDATHRFMVTAVVAD